uniref:cGMP-dependent protein kinase n=2 Tax=Pseudo-nitzschia australis TaxID=44445 RepID=A0A7S4AAF8_9STRA
MKDTQRQASQAVIKHREEQILLQTETRKKNKDRAALRGRELDFDQEFKAPVHTKSPEDAAFLDKALGSNFIFSDLTKKERKMLIDAMQQEKAEEGDVIIQQGEEGDFFYICQTGKINFICDGNAVGSCGASGSFGELALLYDSPRAASCMAGADTVLWKVDQETFRHLLARSAKEVEGNIIEVLSKVDLFKSLDRKTLTKFVDVLSSVKYGEGQRIVEKGQKGDVFYIVKSGQVRVHDIGLGDATFADEVHEAGYWFGERALMTGAPRAATVTAMTPVTVLACTRDTFESNIGSLESILGKASRKRFIKSVPIFSKSMLSEREFDHLASMLKVRKYEKGLKLAEAGKVGDNPSLWIVREGKLMITNSKGKIFFSSSGDYYGDKAVQANGEYVSTETCIVEEDAVCWRLKRSDIELVIGDVKRLGKPIPFTPKAFDSTIGIEDIKKHKMLGMGAFGKVWLCTSRESQEPYALKMITKRDLIDAGQVKGVLREKQIMASIEHPFILPLVGSFQDTDFLYLLSPVGQGGELFNVVHTDARDGLDNDASRFYGACILGALGYLHARNIVYRDLKPENALIDKDGYCIMVDFGFAKIVVDKTYTLCGTPEYLAPEIIMSKGHDKAVDYWSFGVLVYEMLVGQSPFYMHGTDQVSLFKRIVMVKYSCPSYVSPEAKDLLKKLLCRRQAVRIGNQSRGHLDIEDHPWFETLSFRKLNKRKLKAPFKPKISSALDTRNFDDFSRVEREKHRGKALSSKEQEYFKGF